VAQASRGVEQERNRLAALMSELTQSVVVCNLDGRVLLYNNRARMQFRALSDAPALAGGSRADRPGPLDLHGVRPPLVAHALESLQQRLQRGVPNPSAQFVTTTRGPAAARADGAGAQRRRQGDGAAHLTGFVLMLDNITRDYEQSARERLLHGLTEGSRGALANLQAAVEMLDDEGLEPAMRERFLGVVRDEARRHEPPHQRPGGTKRRRPGHALAAGRDAGRRFRAGRAAPHRKRDRAAHRQQRRDAELWLKLDSFSLLQALAYLALRLRDEFEVIGRDNCG
jgi:DNA polymerase-3 subunit epsilon